MDAPATLRLFAVYVGGSVAGAHVELHDVRFAVGATIEDCYDALRAQWWGEPQSLHLDAWGPLDVVDGHRVTIGAGPAPGAAPRLWFVNLGGYDPAEFAELHRNVFVVAEDARAARKRALERIAGWASPHKDYVHEVETVADVAASLAAGRCIRLEPTADADRFVFETGYLPIGRMG